LRQVPVVPQEVGAVTAHWPWGSGARSGTAVHVPAEAVRLQARHAPVHALSQHTPWAQNPDAHSLAAAQSAPRGLRPHEPLVQNSPGAQSALPPQPVWQVSPLQAKGLQVREREATHWPVALQVGGGL
jgi:hypothetical protein